MTRWLTPRTAEILWRLLEFIDTWFGLPTRWSDTLHFRKSFAEFLPSVRPSTPKRVLWIHGASVGELEDLADFFLSAEKISAAGFTPQQIVLTASSYSARSRLTQWKNLMDFAYAGPLPEEKLLSYKKFFEYFAPEIFVLSHSDYWPIFFVSLKINKRLKCLWLPEGSTPKHHAKLSRWQDLPLHSIGVAESSAVPAWRESASAMGVPVLPLGVPRIDRIRKRQQNSKNATLHPLTEFGAQPDPEKLNIIVGSAWPEDAHRLGKALAQIESRFRSRLKIVVLPHETENPLLVAQIAAALPSAKLVVAQGILLESYKGFDLAWVGGGYKTGLHNILEPLLWGIPSLCGPLINKQSLAPKFIEMGSLKTVSTETQALQLLGQWASDEPFRKSWILQARQSQSMLENEFGATDRLAKHIHAMKGFST